MCTPEQAEEAACPAGPAMDGVIPFGLLALKRQSQFHDFLLHELNACRTETERKVVLSALLTSKVRMRHLAESIKAAREEAMPRREVAGDQRRYSS